jgi:hypothetical protein
MNKPQIEALKEFGRVVLIAAVSAGLVAAQAAVGLITDPITNVGLATLIAALIKAWDKYVHKNPAIDANGVVPF